MGFLAINFKNYIDTFPKDISASLVVFLVALPLNLGIALASGAPLMAGVISGVIGGIVVGLISKSALSVSGPAAGLTLLVAAAIQNLGSFPAFLMAVMLSGFFQIIFGLVKGGSIALFFPSAVIKGMLAAIGIVIILKQIPHLLGIDVDAFGKMVLFQNGGNNIISEIFSHIKTVPAIISLFSLGILILWNRRKAQKYAFFTVVPAPLVVVLAGTGIAELYTPGNSIEPSHFVALPVVQSFRHWAGNLSHPDFNLLFEKSVWLTGLTLAVVASIETLLSTEATDKIDPKYRKTPANRELIAQGSGNVLCGLFGGIPVSAVVVRSTVNLNAGAQTKMASVYHGALLFMAVVFISPILNKIPLAALAAILTYTGYKLSRPILYRSYFRLGRTQFIPFVTTIAAILITDLLIGIAIGMAVGIGFILWAHYQAPLYILDENKTNERPEINIQLSEIVSFLNKANLRVTLNNLPRNAIVTIDGTNTRYIDYDVLEVIYEFRRSAKLKDIDVNFISIPRFKKTRS